MLAYRGESTNWASVEKGRGNFKSFGKPVESLSTALDFGPPYDTLCKLGSNNIRSRLCGFTHDCTNNPLTVRLTTESSPFG